jgi:DNA-binding response OmpR family regulator
MKPENMTILTVDDTPANIRLLTHYLEKQGYRVITAEDGFEGFKAAIQYHPDLVLLDVMMPGTDGYEVCELLKAEEETKDIPIVFLTAKAEVEDRLHGFELGAVDYITKPFNLVEISTRVKTHLRLKYLEDQQHRTGKILMQTQKLASLGKSDSVFVRRLANMTADLEGQLKTAAHDEKERNQQTRKAGALVHEMRQILSDLQSFADATAADTEKIKINDLVDSVLELVRPGLKSAVRFSIESPSPSPVVSGNLGMLHQTVLNLFLNAIESAIGGGTIAVKVSQGPLPVALSRQSGADPDKEYVHIALTDAGQRKEQVRFDKDHGIYSTARNNLNAGIRLTAMHAIAELHHGLLSLLNGDGEILTVSLILPAITA